MDSTTHEKSRKAEDQTRDEAKRSQHQHARSDIKLGFYKNRTQSYPTSLCMHREAIKTQEDQTPPSSLRYDRT